MTPPLVNNDEYADLVEDSGQTVEFRPNRLRTALILVGSLAFVGIGLWLLTQGLLAAVLGTVSVVLGGWGALATGRNLPTGVWTIRADSHGLSFGPGANVGEWSIPWSSIDKVGVAKLHRQHMLGLRFVDAQAVADSVPGAAARKLVRTHRSFRGLGGTAIATGSLMGESADQEILDPAIDAITSPSKSVADGFAVCRRLAGFDIAIASASFDKPIHGVAEQLDQMRQ